MLDSTDTYDAASYNDGYGLTNSVAPATTYSTASTTSGDGVSWLSSLMGVVTPLASTAATLYGTISTNKTAAQLAAEKSRLTTAQAVNNQSSTVMYLVIGVVVLVIGFFGLRLLRSK